MRWPSSLFHGLKSRPGNSFPSFAHLTIRGIALSPSWAFLYNPIPAAESPRRRQAGKRLPAFLPRHGKCYSFFLLVSADIDVELLSFFNRPGTPWLDSVMGAASNRGVLLPIAALPAT